MKILDNCSVLEMDSTNSSKKRSQVKYVYDDVQVHIGGPHKEEEAIYEGKLLIVHEFHGAVVEWHPVKEIDLSGKQRLSPDTENLDWEDVSSAVVGYRANRSCSIDAVEIKSSIRIPNSIVFDIGDLKSYKRVELPEERKNVITFFLKDGTNIPSLYFDSSNFITFFEALNNYISFKRSKKDSTLYLITDPKMLALEKSFSELELFGENKSHIVTKFFQDPYATAMGSFSKVTNFLLDYMIYGSGSASPSRCTDEEVAEMLSENIPNVEINHQEEPGFEVITCMELPPRPDVKRSEPLTYGEWISHIDSDGRVKDVESLKLKIFKGGLTHSVRSEAWKYLLGYFNFNYSSKEQELRRKQKVDDYYRMKLQWKTITPEQESRFAALRDRRSLIEKDVSRTDRTHPFFEGDNNPNVQMLYDILMTYCMFNFDLGYVQGMSDLLSPILVVMQNEADAFWCFSGWLDRVGVNFELDQQGMKTQLQNLHRLIHFADPQLCDYFESHESGNLYFCFRWLLILFKRDFKFQEIMRIWEVLWTELPCKNFHLLICLAILDSEKLTIMENNYGLTEILKHINDMSYKINLEETLCKAEAIYMQIKQCSHLSDIVQNILGIQPSFETEEIVASTIPVEQAVGEIETINSIVEEKLDENSASPISGDSSVDNIDEYVDLEQQYQISFGLFT